MENSIAFPIHFGVRRVAEFFRWLILLMNNDTSPQSIDVAESLKLLAQFCQSYHFLMHKVTSFQSLKVRFTDLIKRKMDLCDFERLFSI